MGSALVGLLAVGLFMNMRGTEVPKPTTTTATPPTEPAKTDAATTEPAKTETPASGCSTNWKGLKDELAGLTAQVKALQERDRGHAQAGRLHLT